MRPSAVTLLFIVAVLAVGLLIGFSVRPGDWYAGLEKPFFTPPNWVFAPAWTTLYVLIAIAGARTWLRAPRSPAMTLWAGQMALNFLWSPVFFGAEAVGFGLIVIAALLITVIAFIANRWERDRVAALLFVPYAAWVAYAGALNLAIWWLN